MTITEFIQHPIVKEKASARLINALRYRSFLDGDTERDIYDLNQEDILTIRNIGNKTWREFANLRLDLHIAFSQPNHLLALQQPKQYTLGLDNITTVSDLVTLLRVFDIRVNIPPLENETHASALKLALKKGILQEVQE